MKIVTFYDTNEYQLENRVFSPATVTVIDYISQCCVENGEQVEIISPAETKNTYGIYPFRSKDIAPGITLTQGKNIGYNNNILRIYSKVMTRLWLVKYLLLNVRKGELVFFFDSPVLYEPLIIFRLLSKYKKIKILYFASEIFQQVIKMNVIKRRMEWFLFDKADKYIFSTKMLNSQINRENKPYIILNGVYKPALPMHLINKKETSNIISIVYAGIINSKKGSRQAIELAQYLDDNYHIHILGYGTDRDIAELKENIESLNILNKCKISYEGLLSGDDYNRFLQQCHIGLCTQNLGEKYNNTSFPSKILTYLANGMRVVSVDLEPVRTSEVGELLYYSISDKPEDIALTIKSIDFKAPYDSRIVLNKLHHKFLEDLKSLIRT